MASPKDNLPPPQIARVSRLGDGGFQRLLVATQEEHDRELRKAKREKMRTWAASSLGMVVALLGIVVSVFSFSSEYFQKHGTLTDRISSLTKSLNDSARIIGDIEKEVNQRQELLGRLQRDADEAKNLAALNSAQANAVVQALRGELDKESNKSFWTSTLQGIVFALLGALFGVTATETWRRLGESRKAQSAKKPEIERHDE